jgi:protein arginine N-methyltransferase 1
MYSLDQFAAMFSDKIRMPAYSAAIARVVRPGDTVVDLGCGPGVFALLACKAGARRVFAIDLNGVVDFGRHLAAVNGFSDRIQFFCGDSRRILLPERANAIVADVRGAMPLYSHSVGTLEDARVRFLAEGGRMVPAQDTLFAAIVEIPEHYRALTDSWKAVPDLDLSSGLPLVLNGLYRHHIMPSQVVSDARVWHVLDFTRGASIPAQGGLEFVAKRSAVAHGIGLWFETELTDGIGYSTEPSDTETIYGQIFLPWLEPVRFETGDTCQVDLSAHLVGNDYIWRWETSVPPSRGRAPVRFEQSTFYGSVFSPSFLRKHAADFVPVLTEAGLAERWLLAAMNGERKLEEIAAEGARIFPHVFPRPEEALHRAADLAEKFSR